MSRNKSLLILLFLIIVLTGTATAEKGSLIAGTYWIEIDPDGADSIPGMLTLNADGVVLASQFLSPFTNNGRGNWKKVNSRGAKGRFLAFNYFPDGTLADIVEVTFEGELDQSCESGTMAFVISVYFPDQNPLDEDEVPFWTNTGFFYLTRIPVD